MKENFRWQGKQQLEHKTYFTPIIYFAFLTIFIGSCTNQPKQEEAPKNALASTESQIQHEDSSNSIMSTQLDILYLNNTTANPQLDILMNRSGSKEKLICQFYLRNNGKITMGIYPAKKKNQDIDRANVQMLTNGRFSGQDVSRGELFFGDQEITGTAYTKLKAIVNTAGNEFIVFTPTLSGNHIRYEITSVGSLSALNATAVGFTNPSPPKDADDLPEEP